VLATNFLCLVGASGGLAAAATTIAQFNYAPSAAFAGAFLGCLTTLELSAFGLAPSIASATAAALLCGELLLTRTTRFFQDTFFPALYGGTFAGMTSILWSVGGDSGPSLVAMAGSFIALSAVCGLAFLAVAHLDGQLNKPIGHGYGGRLGATAAIASFLFIDFGHRLLAVERSASLDISAAAVGTPAGAAIDLMICMVGIFVTLAALRQRDIATAGMPTRIFVASTLALLGLVTLHVTDPSDPRRLGEFYAGCFLGMSTPERLKGWIQPVCGAILLTLILTLVRAVLPDVGGGGGLAAFITVAMLATVSRMMERTRQAMGHRERIEVPTHPASSDRHHFDRPDPNTDDRDCAIIRIMRSRSGTPSALTIHRQPSLRGRPTTWRTNSESLGVVTDIAVMSVAVSRVRHNPEMAEVPQS
jgi:hypothetical protein